MVPSRSPILNLGHVNAVMMDYRVDMHLVQQWIDPWLSSAHPGYLIIPTTPMEKIWLPDTYFVNSKQARYHTITSVSSLDMEKECDHL